MTVFGITRDDDILKGEIHKCDANSVVSYGVFIKVFQNPFFQALNLVGILEYFDFVNLASQNDWLAKGFCQIKWAIFQK